MKVANKLTEADLVERLDEVLDRASHGEEFEIERDGEVFAVIRPPAPNAKPGITWGEFVARYPDLPQPDDRFADDLEAILAEQRNAPHGNATRGTTWEEFAARVGDLEFPGDGFADDLEAIQAAQGIAEAPEWPDCLTPPSLLPLAPRRDAVRTRRFGLRRAVRSREHNRIRVAARNLPNADRRPATTAPHIR